MIHSSREQKKISPKLLKYLEQRVGLSISEINLGLKQADIEQAPLPIILWSFGLLTLEQYQQVLDWQNINQ